ncbi:MAG TPA: hypothetical protein DEQ88_04815 [Clostridiales bacterium]|nr:hypothetical protein [Clostridiales bacterium]
MAEKKQKSKTSENQKVSTGRLKLLVTVVPRAKAEFYADLIQSFDVNMQMLSSAQGTAGVEIMDLLGLADKNKTVIFSVIKVEKVAEAAAALEEKFDSIKNGKGIAFTVPMTSIIGVLVFGFLSDNRNTVKE